MLAAHYLRNWGLFQQKNIDPKLILCIEKAMVGQVYSELQIVSGLWGFLVPVTVPWPVLQQLSDITQTACIQ